MREKGGHTPPVGEQNDLRLPPIGNDHIPLARAIGRLIRVTIGATIIVFGVLILGSVTIPWQRSVAASGTLEPEQVWPVRSIVSGIVARLCVATGDSVVAGQVLVVLDTTEGAAEVRRLRRELAHTRRQVVQESSLSEFEAVSAQSKLERAEASLIRSRANLREELANRGITTHLDSVRGALQPGTNVGVDRALAEVLSAEAEVRESRAQRTRTRTAGIDELLYKVSQLETQLSRAIEELSKKRIVSALSGTVVTDDIERLSGASVNAGEALFEVAALSSWRARLAVREADAHRVAAGNRVSLEIPSLAKVSGRRAFGTIERVGVEPSSAPGFKVYGVAVRLDQAVPNGWQSAMRRGLSVRGRIVVGRSTVARWGWERLRG